MIPPHTFRATPHRIKGVRAPHPATPKNFYVFFFFKWRCSFFSSLSLSLFLLCLVPFSLFLSLSPSPLPVSLHRARLRFQNEQTAKMMSASIASFLKHVVTKGAVKKQKQKNQLPLSLSLSPSLKAAAAVPAAALPRPRRLLLLSLDFFFVRSPLSFFSKTTQSPKKDSHHFRTRERA